MILDWLPCSMEFHPFMIFMVLLQSNYLVSLRLAILSSQILFKSSFVCVCVGWGKSRSFSNISEMMKESEQPSKHLMKIDVPLLSRDDCIQKFNSSTGNGSLIQDENMFWKKMMCGGSPDPSVGKICFCICSFILYLSQCSIRHWSSDRFIPLWTEVLHSPSKRPASVVCIKITSNTVIFWNWQILNPMMPF